MTTRLGAYGGARSPYGSFSGKEENVSGPHAPGDVTRLGVYGGPRELYGSFAGKVPATSGPKAPGTVTRLGMYGGARPIYPVLEGKPTATITRLGMYGGPRPLYGSFANKEAIPIKGGGSSAKQPHGAYIKYPGEQKQHKIDRRKLAALAILAIQEYYYD